MQLTISQKVLKSKIAEIIKLAATNSSHVVLETFKLEAVIDTLKLTAFNLTVGACVHADAKVSSKGTICVNAAQFQKSVNAMSGTLSLTIDGTLLVISSETATLKLITIPADNFPGMLSLEDAATFDINTEVLLEALNSTLFNVGSESAKLILSGVNMQLVDGKVKLAASDQTSLSYYEHDLPYATDVTCNVTIPNAALLELVKMLTGAKGKKGKSKDDSVEGFPTIAVAFTTGLVKFSWGKGQYLVSRLLADSYFNYSQIMPHSTAHLSEFDVATKELSDAIDLLMVVIDEKSNCMVRAEIAETMLKLSAQSSTGVATADIYIGSGWNGSLLLNGKSLQKYLKQTKSKNVGVAITDKIIVLKDDTFTWLMAAQRV